jgi:hypothetical protein
MARNGLKWAFWPKWPEMANFGLDFGQKNGQIWPKKRPDSGKKWPILSRMGELLKGRFLA